MARNGTSHLVAESDLDGALKVIQWLAYVPERKGKPIPISPSQDSWDREVTYAPPKGPYDPRWLLQGNKEEGLTGLFDDGSFFVGRFF
jgi:acetyl-CoA carboxylase/biotin carboxylase 1